jgi:hypothetical protein
MSYFQKRDYAAILVEHSPGVPSPAVPSPPAYVGPTRRALAGVRLAKDFQLLKPAAAVAHTQALIGEATDQWLVFAFSG